MSAKYENIYFATIYNESGFTERDYFQIRDIINASKPNYWILLQPNTIDIYYLPDSNRKERCDDLVNKVKELKKSSPIFHNIGIASSLEKSIVERSIFGKMKSLPLLTGSKMNVSKLAIENSKDVVAT
jgi:hypothetical protein